MQATEYLVEEMLSLMKQLQVEFMKCQKIYS